MGRHFCRHSPGACVYWKYTLGTKRLVSISFDRRPAWGNTYTTLQISKYMNPFLTIGNRL